MAARLLAKPGMPTVAEGFGVEKLGVVSGLVRPSAMVIGDDGRLLIAGTTRKVSLALAEQGIFPATIVISVKATNDGSLANQTVFADELESVYDMVWRRGELCVLTEDGIVTIRDTNDDHVADVRRRLPVDLPGRPGFTPRVASLLALGMDDCFYLPAMSDHGFASDNHHAGAAAMIPAIFRISATKPKPAIFATLGDEQADVLIDAADRLQLSGEVERQSAVSTTLMRVTETGAYDRESDKPSVRQLTKAATIHVRSAGVATRGAVYPGGRWPAAFQEAVLACATGDHAVIAMPTTSQQGGVVDAIRLLHWPDGDVTPWVLCFRLSGDVLFVAATDDRLGTVLYRVTLASDNADGYAAGFDGSAVTPLTRETPSADLIAAMRHPSRLVRQRAQWALADMGHEAVEPLREAARDRSWPTINRAHALWTLHHIMQLLGDNAADLKLHLEVIRALHNGPAMLRAQAARILGRQGEARDGLVTKHLYRRMQRDDDAEVRTQCAIALGLLGDNRAAAELFASLADDDITARFAKIQALRRLNYWPIAFGYVNSAEASVRMGAIEAMAGVFDVQAVTVLAFAARQGAHEATRLAAIAPLGQVLRKPALEPRRLITAPVPVGPRRFPPPARTWAGSALVEQTLRELADDPSPAIAEAARSALSSTK